MKTKSYVLMLSTLLAAFALLATPASAEAPGYKQKQSEVAPQRQAGDRLAQMRERLELTDAQVEQLRPVLAAEREELKAKRKELGREATRAERQAAVRAVRAKYIPQIDAVLTPDQLAKVAMQRERMAKRIAAGDNGGPAGPGGAKGAGGPNGGGGPNGVGGGQGAGPR